MIRLFLKHGPLYPRGRGGSGGGGSIAAEMMRLEWPSHGGLGAGAPGGRGPAVPLALAADPQPATVTSESWGAGRAGE